MRPELLLTVVFSLAYLVGSIPFSLLIAWWVKGIDLRKVGSGNVGATNVGRAIGYRWGVVALLCDALKGLLPTLFLRVWATPAQSSLQFSLQGHLAVVAGVAAILGHLFPVWLRFRGGKGVATALGVVAILAPWGMLAAAVVFALVFVWKRTVSVGSICAALTFGLFQLIYEGAHLWTADQWSLGLFSVLAPLLIIGMHWSNIVRLWQGTEPNLQTPATSNTSDTAEPQ